MRGRLSERHVPTSLSLTSVPRVMKLEPALDFSSAPRVAVIATSFPGPLSSSSHRVGTYHFTGQLRPRVWRGRRDDGRVILMFLL